MVKKKYKVTPRIIEVILSAISEGLSQREVSILVVISEDILSNFR